MLVIRRTECGKQTNALRSISALTTLLVLAAFAATATAEPTPSATPTAAERPAVQSPVEPERSLALFELPDDLTIQLVAAEPEVVDPIDMRFDAHGRLFVAEMGDYPLGPGAGKPPLSRIKLLEDTDGDGRYETAHVFAEQLPFVTGLQPWNDGLIVTIAGRVAFMKDTDGDFRADVNDTWFTGFAEENSQLRANHPCFAFDNQIYIANGLRGGKVIDVRRGESTLIDISGRDFHFDPRGDSAAAITGVGQYGMCFDDFGNRFVCQNRNPLQHVVFEESDLKTSKHFTPPAVVNDVAAFAEKSKLFPLTKTWTTSNLHENTFTAACGVNIFRGHALPETYRGLAFTCDPTGNLVHAERMQPWGPTFRSEPLLQGKEFLASTDPWFRPVAVENGPDGALYIVDMYRAVIEHPDFVPEELKARPDQRWGDERGRIYRIVAKKRTLPASATWPAAATNEQLVQLLADENAWQRETAQRLLIERNAVEQSSAIAKLVASDQPTPVFHALWTLQGLQELTPELLTQAASSSDARVVRTAAKLYATSPEQFAAVRKMLVSGPDSKGHEHLAGIWTSLSPLSLNELGSRAAHVAAHESDPWSRYELLLNVHKPASPTLEALLTWVDEHSAGTTSPLDWDHFRALTRDVARLAGAMDDRETLNETLEFLNKAWTRDANFEYAKNGLLGLAEGLQKRALRLADYAATESARDVVERATHSALSGVDSETNSLPLRLLDLEMIACLDSPDCRTMLRKLTRDGEQAIRMAAIKAALSVGDEATATELLARAASESPPVKRVIFDTLCNSAAGTTLLLGALESKQLQPGDLDPTLVPRLVNQGDAALRERAKKLLVPPVDPNRQKTIDTYVAALGQAANPKQGRGVFGKNCAACHRVGDVGVTVAPDISDSRTKTAQQILMDILEPNRAVDGNYVAYVITTDDGKTRSGVIAAESAQAITLKQPGGEATVIPRNTIEEMISTGRSFMPEGLERTISPSEMAHLVSYIKNWRYLDGRVPAATVQK